MSGAPGPKLRPSVLVGTAWVSAMSCTCILASPAAAFGLSTFHGALCMQHRDPYLCRSTAKAKDVTPSIQPAVVAATTWVTASQEAMKMHVTGLKMQWATAM